MNLYNGIQLLDFSGNLFDLSLYTFVCISNKLSPRAKWDNKPCNFHCISNCSCVPYTFIFGPPSKAPARSTTTLWSKLLKPCCFCTCVWCHGTCSIGKELALVQCKAVFIICTSLPLPSHISLKCVE